MSNVTEKEEALYVVRAARQELHRLAQKCMMFGADPTGLNQKMCDILEDTLQQLRRTEAEINSVEEPGIPSSKSMKSILESSLSELM